MLKVRESRCSSRGKECGMSQGSLETKLNVIREIVLSLSGDTGCFKRVLNGQGSQTSFKHHNATEILKAQLRIPVKMQIEHHVICTKPIHFNIYESSNTCIS